VDEKNMISSSPSSQVREYIRLSLLEELLSKNNNPDVVIIAMNNN
jgi:hypothetical protein